MFDQEAIHQLIKAEATNACNEAIQHALSDGQPLAALPDEFTLKDLEKFLPLRRRARNLMETRYVADFSRYVKLHREVGCTIYINAERMTAKAVLNQGTPGEPGHGDNAAVVQLVATAPYEALATLCASRQSQKSLAEWLEEWRDHIVPLDKDLGELNIGHVVSGIRSVSIESINSSTSTVEALSAERSEMESVAAKTHRQDAVLPVYLKLTTKPFKELPERTFYVRLSIITSESKPFFALSILGMDLHQQEMADEFAHVVRESFAASSDEASTALIGMPAPEVLLGTFSVRD